MKDFQEIKDLKPLQRPSDHRSFVSSDPNTDRLEVEYYFDKKSEHLYTKVKFGKHAQGPPNHVHGGATSAVFDEAMGAVVWANGYPAVTRSMHVDFVTPLPLGTEVLVETWIDRHDDKEILCSGCMWDLRGTLYAEAAGQFTVRSKEYFENIGEVPEEMFKALSSK